MRRGYFLLIEKQDGNPGPGDHVHRLVLTAWRASVCRYRYFKSEFQVARGTRRVAGGHATMLEKYYETIRHFTARDYGLRLLTGEAQAFSDRLVEKPAARPRSQVS